MEEIILVLKKYGSGKRNIEDIFFQDGNEHDNIFVRQGVNIKEDTSYTSLEENFECNVPGCNDRFDTLILYEMHYNTMHRFICKECKKRLSSPHLLDLHISEEHDSYFAVVAQKKPMYRCFVESCHELFLNSKERSTHAINIHQFPSDFRFNTNNKIKNKNKSKRHTITKNSKSESSMDTM